VGTFEQQSSSDSAAVVRAWGVAAGLAAECKILQVYNNHLLLLLLLLQDLLLFLLLLRIVLYLWGITRAGSSSSSNWFTKLYQLPYPIHTQTTRISRKRCTTQQYRYNTTTSSSSSWLSHSATAAAAASVCCCCCCWCHLQYLKSWGSICLAVQRNKQRTELTPTAAAAAAFGLTSQQLQALNTQARCCCCCAFPA
jgi:hypothetical protein